MFRTSFTALLCSCAFVCSGQGISAFADSLRHAYGLPEIGYAVVSPDSVLLLDVLGVKQAGADRSATPNDHFRIGSNTKVVTAYLAARLVERGVLNWDTRFFALFPELEKESNQHHRDLTLLDLLTFHARFIPWTYTDTVPRPDQFPGNEVEQRGQFLRWAFAQPTVAKGNGVHFSNVCYVAAGAMLERASGRTYEQLIGELGKELGIDFRFGAPNMLDSLDTWGHASDGEPQAPAPDPKLGWLLAAGGISMSLPDHAAFIRLQLKAVMDMVPWLTPKGFASLEHTRPTYALAWRWITDADGAVRLYHVGNPGTFLTKVFLHPFTGRAYLLYTNRQSDGANAALDALYERLVRVGP